MSDTASPTELSVIDVSFPIYTMAASRNAADFIAVGGGGGSFKSGIINCVVRARRCARCAALSAAD